MWGKELLPPYEWWISIHHIKRNTFTFQKSALKPCGPTVPKAIPVSAAWGAKERWDTK